MAILITGGTGFIGSNTVRFLAEQGREVVAYDLFYPNGTSVLDDIKGEFKLEIGNITDLSHILWTIKKYNIKGIIHGAAMIPVPATNRPIEALHLNIIGTANILEAARIADLERVVILSSSAVMGGPEDLVTPRKEEDIVLPASGIYALSKLTCEQLTHSYRTVYGVDAIAVRPRCIYGPGGRPHLTPIWEVVMDAVAGKDIIQKTGGDSAFDLTYVKDCSKGLLQAYDCKSPTYYVYNMSRGRNRTMAEVCDVLRDLFPDLTIEVGPGLWHGALDSRQPRKHYLSYFPKTPTGYHKGQKRFRLYTRMGYRAGYS